MTGLDKIRSFLEDRHKRTSSELWERLRPNERDAAFEHALEAAWAEYLNAIDCQVLYDDDVLEDFEHLFNNLSETSFCVLMNGLYLLVPKKLAEKALILGGLPDFWSPDS
jgi:hypothetical protein